MRINGRTLRPTTLSERRLLLSLGLPELKVSRKHNPYIVARRLARAARGQTPDHEFLHKVARMIPPFPPPPVEPFPGPDHSEPVDLGEECLVAG